MLPAGGLIMMPEYGSTSCRCGYPIQTSVVMAPADPAGAKQPLYDDLLERSKEGDN